MAPTHCVSQQPVTNARAVMQKLEEKNTGSFLILGKTMFPHFFKYKIQGRFKDLSITSQYLSRTFFCMLKKCFNFKINSAKHHRLIKIKDFYRFIKVFTKIKDFSRPGIIFFKSKDFSRFHRPVGTMNWP